VGLLLDILPVRNSLHCYTCKYNGSDMEDVELIREGHVVIGAAGSVLKLDMMLRTSMLTHPARISCIAIGLTSRYSMESRNFQRSIL